MSRFMSNGMYRREKKRLRIKKYRCKAMEMDQFKTTLYRHKKILFCLDENRESRGYL
jgi:hypothetical protein